VERQSKVITCAHGQMAARGASPISIALYWPAILMSSISPTFSPSIKRLTSPVKKSGLIDFDLHLLIENCP
jgi:hypothetical protein